EQTGTSEVDHASHTVERFSGEAANPADPRPTRRLRHCPASRDDEQIVGRLAGPREAMRSRRLTPSWIAWTPSHARPARAKMKPPQPWSRTSNRRPAR